jgi:excisionase family DNA binding protein
MIRKKELANELKVSLRTIDNWIRQRRIPYLRLSPRLLLFDLRKVLSALEKYEVRAVERRLA